MPNVCSMESAITLSQQYSVPHPQAAASTLTPEQAAALAEGRRRAKKVRTAVVVAYISSALLLFGCLSAMGSVPKAGPWAGMVALVFAMLAAHGFYSALRMKRFDARSATRLGFQHVFMALAPLIILIPLWNAAFEILSEFGLLPFSAPFTQPDNEFRNLGLKIYALYGFMTLLYVGLPGLLAWYFFTRARIVRDVVAGTPAWVLDAMK